VTADDLSPPEGTDGPAPTDPAGTTDPAGPTASAAGTGEPVDPTDATASGAGTGNPIAPSATASAAEAGNPPALGPAPGATIGTPPADAPPAGVPPVGAPATEPLTDLGSVVPPTGGRRSPRRWFAVGAVAVVAAGAGVFGIRSLGESPGATSPEAAVDAFFDAVDGEDVIGVLEAVEPQERELLRRAVDRLTEAADRAEVTEGLDLHGVDGVDLAVTGVEHTVERYTDTVAAVDLTAGTIRGAVEPADLPFGATVRSVLGDEPGDADSADDDLAGLRIMTVQRSGRWYVSAAYTAAEALRLAAEDPAAPPTFTEPVEATGAASAEEAVRELAAGLDGLDADRVLAVVSPERGRVLHDYARPLRDLLAEGDAGDFDLEVFGLATAAGPDGSTTVTVTGWELRQGDPSDYETTQRHEDGCTTYTGRYPDYDYETDTVGEPVEETWSSCDEDSTSRWGPSPLLVAGLVWPGDEELRITLVEEGGRWFVDPLATLVESATGSLPTASTEQLQQLARFWAGADWLLYEDEFWETCGIERPADDADRATGTAAIESCMGAMPDGYLGEYGYDPVLDPTVGPSGPQPRPMTWVEPDDALGTCYLSDDPAEVESCLGDAVDRGELAPEDLALFRCSLELYGPDLGGDDEQVGEDLTDEQLAEYEACTGAAFDAGG